MIKVLLKGRMGNQMFQIAAAQALASKNSDEFLCDVNIMGIKPTDLETEKHRATIFKKVPFCNLTNFRNLHNDSENFEFSPIEYKNEICLSGYYQSEKYFLSDKVKIKNLFSAPDRLKSIIEKRFCNLLSKENTCSVHIRRGDYLKFKDYHNNLTKQYYLNCFDIIGSDNHFVFFSDDIEWCKETFSDMNASFINTGFDVLDFYLMSYMKNNIIANSSYSWWAAWMNDNQNKKVLAPSVWFGEKNSNFSTRDITPERWEKIDA